MFIYLIEQTVSKGYDTYDSAIVVAHDADEASKIHPREFFWLGSSWGTNSYSKSANFDWARPEDVSVTLLGVADKKFDRPQVIISSYHAG